MTQALSEVYRIAAKEWAGLEAAAKLMEETKSAHLSQMMMATGHDAVSKAEMVAKASPQWFSYLRDMSKAREAANLKWVEVEWIKMRFSEQQSQEATERAERRL